MIIYKRNCNNCKKYYKGYGKYFCSHICKGIVFRKRVDRVCKNCNKEFNTWPSYIKLGRGKYCSNKCSGEDHTRYSFNDFAFSKYTPKSCYWAGFIAADGCVMTRKNYKGKTLQISSAEKDIKHLQSFLDFLKSDYPIYFQQKGCYTIKIGRANKISKDLKNNFNITSRKSLTLQYPKQMPREFDRYFIRGFFDGDGWLCKKNKDFQLVFGMCSGSKTFLETIQEILIKNCSLNKTKLCTPKQSNATSLVYSGNKQVPKIMNFLNVSFGLQRKSLEDI